MKKYSFYRNIRAANTSVPVFESRTDPPQGIAFDYVTCKISDAFSDICRCKDQTLSTNSKLWDFHLFVLAIRNITICLELIILIS